MEGTYVVGVDTGFRHVGWCACRLQAGSTFQKGLAPQAMGVILTVAPNKRANVGAGDADWMDSIAIASAFSQMVRAYGPRLVACEGISFVRNSRTMSQIGRTFGELGMLATLDGFPVAHASPVEIKLAVTNNKSATKEEVQQSLDAAFGGVPRMLADMGRIESKHREHAYDALGALVARWEYPTMVLLRQQVSHG